MFRGAVRLMERADHQRTSIKTASERPRAALTSALAELGKKRKAADDAKREMDAAKADEAVQRKARDEAQKNREAAILERLRSQSDTQKPETAA